MASFPFHLRNMPMIDRSLAIVVSLTPIERLKVTYVWRSSAVSFDGELLLILPSICRAWSTLA